MMLPLPTAPRMMAGRAGWREGGVPVPEMLRWWNEGMDSEGRPRPDEVATTQMRKKQPSFPQKKMHGSRPACSMSVLGIWWIILPLFAPLCILSLPVCFTTATPTSRRVPASPKCKPLVARFDNGQKIYIDLDLWGATPGEKDTNFFPGPLYLGHGGHRGGDTGGGGTRVTPRREGQVAVDEDGEKYENMEGNLKIWRPPGLGAGQHKQSVEEKHGPP